MSKQPSLIYTVIFFLKTTLFNVVVNPLLAIFLPFIIFFVATKDIDNKAILFLMIIFCFTFQFTRSFNLSLQKQYGKKNNVGIFYKLLPVNSTILSKSIILTIFIYSIFIYCLLTFFMYKSNQLPDVDDIVIQFDPNIAVTTFSGTFLDARGFRHHFKIYYFPSLFFGIIRDINSWPVFPGYLFILPLLFIAVTGLFLFIKSFNLSIKPVSIPGLCIMYTIGILIFLFLMVIGDIFFSDKTTAGIRLFMENRLKFPVTMVVLLIIGIAANYISFIYLLFVNKQRICNYD